MNNQQVTGIILAAGRGTRMKPLTDKIPKPLAKVPSGITLLEINMNRLFDLVDSYVIVVCYLADQIESFVGDSYRGKKVVFVRTKSPVTGTLDACRAGIGKIQQESDQESDQESSSHKSNYIVTNADTCCDKEYYSKLQESIKINPDQAAFLATVVQDKELLKSLGVFVVDSNNYLQHIAEKSPTFVSNLANVGIYYFPNHIKSFVPELDPRSNTEELITDLINEYLTKESILILSSKEPSYNMSTVEDLQNCSF